MKDKYPNTFSYHTEGVLIILYPFGNTYRFEIWEISPGYSPVLAEKCSVT